MPDNQEQKLTPDSPELRVSNSKWTPEHSIFGVGNTNPIIVECDTTGLSHKTNILHGTAKHAIEIAGNVHFRVLAPSENEIITESDEPSRPFIAFSLVPQDVQLAFYRSGKDKNEVVGKEYILPISFTDDVVGKLLTPTDISKPITAKKIDSIPDHVNRNDSSVVAIDYLVTKKDGKTPLKNFMVPFVQSAAFLSEMHLFDRNGQPLPDYNHDIRYDYAYTDEKGIATVLVVSTGLPKNALPGMKKEETLRCAVGFLGNQDNQPRSLCEITMIFE